MTGDLSVNDVANLRGCHRNTARAWMKELEAKHGTAAVYRRQGRLYTTHDALEKYASLTKVATPKRASLRLAKEVLSQGCRIGELETRLAAVSSEFFEFRRLARSWFKGQAGTIVR